MNDAAGAETTPTLAGRVVHPVGEGIIFGPGTVARDLTGTLQRSGIERPFVVTTASVVRSGLLASVQAILGTTLAGVFEGSQEHTPEPVVLAAAAAAAAVDADGLISLGGSSVVDLTKGVALVLAEGDDLSLLRTHYRADDPGAARRPRLDAPKLTHIALPTTLSGAEFTGGVGISDPLAKAKRIYRDPKLTPRWVILDPDITLATPAGLWAATGMKALADTVEVLCSPRATPLSDAVAAGGLAMLISELGPATEDPANAAARGRCQFAVGMVLPQLGAVGVGLVAGLRHQLGGGLGVGHGVASTIVLPHVMRWNEPACRPGLERAARAAGCDGPEALIAAVDALAARLGLPRRLRDVGVQLADLPAVAEHVLSDGSLATNPRPVTDVNDVLDVLQAAF